MRVKLIEAENVSKKVKDGKREASILDGVSLSVYKGEMLAITGKSGKKAFIASRKGNEFCSPQCKNQLRLQIEGKKREHIR